MRFLIMLEQTETGFAVQVPDLAIATYGESIEAAKRAAGEAIPGNLEAYREAGQRVPEAQGVSNHLENSVSGVNYVFAGRFNCRRTVQALAGFTRLEAGGDDSTAKLAPLRRGPAEWVPAAEVRGEGLFLRLSEAKVSEWLAGGRTLEAQFFGAHRRWRAQRGLEPSLGLRPSWDTLRCGRFRSTSTQHRTINRLRWIVSTESGRRASNNTLSQCALRPTVGPRRPGIRGISTDQAGTAGKSCNDGTPAYVADFSGNYSVF